jgi:hypothetical protein
MRAMYGYMLVGALAILSPLASVQSAEATCLQAQRGSWTGWVNTCSRRVWVNWDDDSYCDGWSCSDNIAPRGRSSATIGPNVSWCEWYDGRTGKGPC